MACHRISSLDKRGIANFDELIHKKMLRILRSDLKALYFDPTTLIEIAVFQNCKIGTVNVQVYSGRAE